LGKIDKHIFSKKSDETVNKYNFKYDFNKSLMDKVVQSCVEVDRKEQMEREKQQNCRGDRKFVSEIVKDIKELVKKYEEQDNFEPDAAVGENNSIEDVAVDENIPVA